MDDAALALQRPADQPTGQRGGPQSVPRKEQRYITLRQGSQVRIRQRGRQRHREAVFGQQLPGHALVIGDDKGDLFQNPQRTAGEIVTFTRWRTYNVQRAHRRVEGP